MIASRFRSLVGLLLAAWCAGCTGSRAPEPAASGSAPATGTHSGRDAEAPAKPVKQGVDVEKQIERIRRAVDAAGAAGGALSVPFPAEWPPGGEKVLVLSYGSRPLATGRAQYEITPGSAFIVALAGESPAEVERLGDKHRKPRRGPNPAPGDPQEMARALLLALPISDLGDPAWRRVRELYAPCADPVWALHDVLAERIPGFVAWLSAGAAGSVGPGP